MAPENAITIRRLYQDVWNGENPGSADDLVHPEYEIHDRDLADQARGPELYKELAAGTRAAFPDARFTIKDILESGKKVAIRWEMEGTHEGAAFGVEATGERVSMEGIEINRFARGELIETWTQADELAAIEQLGGLRPDE